MVQSALRAEDEKKRISRENFMLTSVPITTQAAYEPALYHAVEDHDERRKPVNFYMFLPLFTYIARLTINVQYPRMNKNVRHIALVGLICAGWMLFFIGDAISSWQNTNGQPYWISLHDSWELFIIDGVYEGVIGTRLLLYFILLSGRWPFRPAEASNSPYSGGHLCLSIVFMHSGYSNHKSLGWCYDRKQRSGWYEHAAIPPKLHSLSICTIN